VQHDFTLLSIAYIDARFEADLDLAVEKLGD
jgi:hypothetical protein